MGGTPVSVVRVGDGAAVCEACLVAKSPWSRMRGLLGRRELPPGEGIFLRPASSVHTFFMRFPIDVVFVDRELEVVGIRPRVAPWRMAAQRGARSTLELAAGEIERHGIAVGDQLRIGDDT